MSYSEMSYTKLNLGNGDVLTAEHIARIEKGLTDAAAELGELVSGKQDAVTVLSQQELQAIINQANPDYQSSDPEPEPDPGSGT